MRNLTVTFNYTINGSEVKDFEIDMDGTHDENDVLEAILEHEQSMLDDAGGNEEGAVYTVEMIDLVGLECSEEGDDITLKNIYEVATAYCDCEQDMEVVLAAIACDIQGHNIDEAYNGSYKDDADFAREMAEMAGDYNPKEARWPLNCINWEYAAKELMYDYCEDNGHYFRNL